LAASPLENATTRFAWHRDAVAAACAVAAFPVVPSFLRVAAVRPLNPDAFVVPVVAWEGAFAAVLLVPIDAVNAVEGAPNNLAAASR